MTLTSLAGKVDAKFCLRLIWKTRALPFSPSHAAAALPKSGPASGLLHLAHMSPLSRGFADQLV